MIRTRQFIFTVCAFLLAACVTTTFAGAPNVGGRSGGQKQLPLDGLNGVVMKSPKNSHYLPNKVIIRLKDTPGRSARTAMTSFERTLSRYIPSAVEQIFEQPVIKDGRTMDMSKFVAMTYAIPSDPFVVAAELSKHPDVLYAEPWFIYEVDACPPNDSLRVSNQWPLNKILADSAYCLQAGDTSVVIGVVDTGVEWRHRDLRANIWNNSGESGTDDQGHDKATNGIDDDHDGYIDDVHGWDFGGADYNVYPSPGDNDPSPTSSAAGHGTHVAGIADAVTNNTTGIAGVANNCRLMAIKAASDNDNRGPSGTPYIVYGFEGLLYAAQHGAKVVNLSWGGSGASQYEQEVVDSATALGTLVVAAAGNAATEDPNYPASYRHVLSVAATSSTDARASYTQYGQYVDVCAPGGDGGTLVFSTYYGNSYASISGTSMASPHVAGLAALVACKYPDFTPDQLGEQVRVTCDSINFGGNFKYKMGRGRIDMVKALSKQFPSFRMESFVTKDTVDGNGNGALEPGETFALSLNLKNYLIASTTPSLITLATLDGNVQITRSTWTIDPLGSGQVITNEANPYIVKVNSNIPAGRVVQFILLINNGAYRDFQVFNVLMYPTFATHDANNVQVTFTNNGRIGFNDFDKNTQGVGFTFRGENNLFEGGLMVGTSAGSLVDNVRNENAVQDADFSAISTIYSMSKTDPLATQVGGADYKDALSPDVIGLTVRQKSFEYGTAPDTNYVIVRYDFENTSGATLTNFYAGLFLDWDVTPNYASNKSGFDQNRSLGYAWDADTNDTKTPVYCGVRALDTAGSFHGIINTTGLDLSKAGKWAWLHGGIVRNDTMGDVHIVISEGPFTIPNGAHQKIGFALVAGSSLPDLQRNADFARARWDLLKPIDGVREIPGTRPVTFSLGQNYPNPFNPTTNIDYELPEAGMVTLAVYNVLGQQVTQLVNRNQQAGKYSVNFDASGLPSGMYIYRIAVGGSGQNRFNDAKKLLLVR